MPQSRRQNASTRKTKKKALASTANVYVPEFRVLRAFHHPAAEDGTFGFARFYWMEGTGHRQSMLSNVQKKRRPVDGEGDKDTAAKVEVLLPFDAPEEYLDVNFMVGRYQEKIDAADTTAYAQVTLRFPNAFNSHHPFELARAWARSFYVDGKGVPVILVLHTPYRAGSDSPVHAHALVLLTRLGRFSWGNRAVDLASDKGQQESLASWIAFREARQKPGYSS